MRGIAPGFWKMPFSEKNSQKKSKMSSLLQIWYKHPWTSSNHCTKFQNDRIQTKRAIPKFAGGQEKVRKLFFWRFFPFFMRLVWLACFMRS